MPKLPPQWTLLTRARQLPRTFEERAVIRRAAVLERRRSALTANVASIATDGGTLVRDDMDHTMRVAWELIAMLRANLLSLEERATRVVPAEMAGLIALWTQLYTFDRRAAIVLVWAAWAMLIVAIFVLARVVMPSKLEQFWDSLVPPELVLADLKPLGLDEEAGIAAEISTAIHDQIETLRRRFRLAVALSGLALVLVSVAYVIEQS